MGQLRQILLAALLVFVTAFGLGVAPAMAQPTTKAQVLIGFDRQPGPAEEALVHRAGGTIKYTYHLVPAIAASVPEAAIEGLRKTPRVTSVDPDGEVYLIDAELDNAWGVKRIGAGNVHPYNKGTGVKVAIIDTGIDYSHPDLDANYAGGYDFAMGDSDPMDYHGHGTHVAGIVAAEDNDLDSSVVGVGPEVRLYALKVFDDDGSGGRWSDIIAALQWAVDSGIQVTNNSYGTSVNPGGTVEAAFNNAEAAGVLNVAAAGNSGNPRGKDNKVIWPARYDSVIAVATTDTNDNRAWWSSTGDQVELAAPGVSIPSTWKDGGYNTISGTSMASPHVAGTAALVIATGITDANGNGRINDEVRLRLQQTADDLGDPGRDSWYGFGLVDADEAAPNTTPVEPTHDVAVTGISVASTAGKGDLVPVDVTVANQGTYEETFTVTLTDETDVITIGTETVTLAAGVSQVVGFNWDTATSSLGDHVLKTEASIVGGETDIADNVKTATVSVVEKKALYVDVTTDKATYTLGENVYITVTVTENSATGPVVESASVHVEIVTASGRKYAGDATTGNDGTVTFKLKTKKPDGTGTYDVTATASKSGYDSGSDFTTFEVQ